MYLWTRALQGLALILLVSATPVHATVHIIQIGDFYFSPSGTTVAPGDTVRWMLESGVHQVASDTGSAKSWLSDTLEIPGDSYEIVFAYQDGTGPFAYRCTLHPAMRDTIRVATSCLATGSLSDHPLPLVSDMVYAVRIMGGLAEPPDALYRFDLTGDCVVDTLDLQLLNCYFVEGLSCLDPYPVPTCCFPQLNLSTCPIIMTGDVNEDLKLTISDIIEMLGFVWKGWPPPHPCLAVGDVNCSGAMTSADIIYLIQHVFKGGPAPCDVCTIFAQYYSCP